jgi:hypothetical protein
MTSGQLFGLIGLIALGAVICFAFWQGMKVKPDPNNKMDGGMPPGSVGPDSGAQ